MSQPDFSILLVAANRCVADRLGVAVATVGGQTMRPSFGFVIRAVAARSRPAVFVLWGAHARKKLRLIPADRHAVVQGPHPSPLSAHRGFLGCKHFSATNDYLARRGTGPVDWRLPPRSAFSDALPPG